MHAQEGTHQLIRIQENQYIYFLPVLSFKMAHFCSQNRLKVVIYRKLGIQRIVMVPKLRVQLGSECPFNPWEQELAIVSFI